MKHTIVATVLSGFLGAAFVLVLLGAAGRAGAQGLTVQVAPSVSRAAEVSAGTPLTSTFNYQGQLKNGGAPVNGPCQMAFRLYDAPAGTGLIGNPITTSVPVSQGLFTAGLDFGGGAFNGDGRWLDMQVDCGGGLVALTPRQAVLAAPYALYAASAGALQGHPVSLLAPSAGQVLKWDGSAWTPETAPAGGPPAPASNRPARPGPGAATTVDSDGDVGSHNSIAYGADGLGLISYYDFDHLSLKVLHCGDIACDSGNISTTVDASSNVGPFSSLAIGADGLGLISYYDYAYSALKVLHCGNLTCTSGNISTTVDATASSVGQYSSLTIGGDGLGLISYHDSVHGWLKVLHCGSLTCASGSNTIYGIDTASGTTGRYTSITTGADGFGLISYYDYALNALKVFHCTTATCSAGNMGTFGAGGGNDIGQYSSITIGADGLGLISYYNATTGDLDVVHCGDANCNIGTSLTAVNVTGDVGKYSSITIGADGLGLISYYDAAGALKVLHCGNTICNSPNSLITLVDQAGNVGQYTSITLAADGLGLISYYDVSHGDLKVFHCFNVLCSHARVGR